MILHAIGASLTAFFVSLLMGKGFIRWLKEKQLGQQVREQGPKSHYHKAGTPTMGGALILVTTLLSSLIWGDWSNRYLWVVLVALVGFGAIGWIDDYRKIIRKNTQGLASRWKFFWQSCLSIGISAYLYASAGSIAETALWIPILSWTLPLGLLYIFLGYVVIAGASNAVNLTDGLDGLAIVPTVLVVIALAVCACLAGHPAYAASLGIPFVPGAEGLIVVCLALVGAGLGFLWFNAAPALVFMGDVGSLALGAVLGVMAMILRQELLFFLMSLVFVMETVSVILQVGYFKLTHGKRIFKMAPIHHHFELLGVPDTRVVIRLWIVTAWCVLIALSFLVIH